MSLQNEIYEAFLKAIPEEPISINPEFNIEALEQLIEDLKTARDKEYIFVATSEEMSEKLKGLFPFADVRLMPKEFVAAKDVVTGEQIYIVPAEPKPIKIVFEPSEHKGPGDDWENWGY